MIYVYIYLIGNMPLWWRKPSSKDVKKKISRGSFINVIHRKFNNISRSKNLSSIRGSERYLSDTLSEKGLAHPGSESPPLLAPRCQSFHERSHARPLPQPQQLPSNAGGDDSGVTTLRLDLHECCTPLPVSVPSKYNKPLSPDAWSELAAASVSSNRSMDTNDQPESQFLSSQVSEHKSGNVTAIISSSCGMRHEDGFPAVTRQNCKDQSKPVNLPSNNYTPLSSQKAGPLSTHMTKLQIPPHAGFFSAPESSISTPSRSSVRTCIRGEINSSGFCSGSLYPDAGLVGSGKCSCLGSGQNSGDMSLSSPLSRCSPECSPIHSPRITSPGSHSQNGVGSPLHPWAGGLTAEVSMDSPDDWKTQCHRLPRPPVAVPSSRSCPSLSLTAAASSRNVGQAESLTNSVSCWKKGRLIGSGTYGRVYLGFNSESGEMCAMKEVTLFSDDAMSKDSVQQLEQEINMLSHLRHPNIVRYFGSEMVDDKLYIYLEFVSGGSIHKLLREYGQLGESAIRSYTQQILSGLVYLHARNTVHRDIKGANILVDPTGQVKLADFGMAKHITGQPSPLSFKGSPYWMAPEVIRNTPGSNLAVDIWSLGCTVIEMATAKPPWSQYEGVAALFKIGNSGELPAIPDHLSEEGKDFVRQCLQRNPLDRPTASQLLQHPFVRNTTPLKRSLRSSEQPELLQPVNALNNMDMECNKRFSCLDTKGAAQPSRGFKIGFISSDAQIPKHLSCPVSPIGSPLLHPKSLQTKSSRMRFQSTIFGAHTSASSTPYTGATGGLPAHHFTHSRTYSYESSALERPKNSFRANRNPLYCKSRLESETSFGIQKISQARSKTVSSRSLSHGKSIYAACSAESKRKL